jgi:hypothetical protein
MKLLAGIDPSVDDRLLASANKTRKWAFFNLNLLVQLRTA